MKPYSQTKRGWFSAEDEGSGCFHPYETGNQLAKIFGPKLATKYMPLKSGFFSCSQPFPDPFFPVRPEVRSSPARQSFGRPGAPKRRANSGSYWSRQGEVDELSRSRDIHGRSVVSVEDGEGDTGRWWN